mgnify:FL=1
MASSLHIFVYQGILLVFLFGDTPCFRGIGRCFSYGVSMGSVSLLYSGSKKTSRLFYVPTDFCAPPIDTILEICIQIDHIHTDSKWALCSSSLYERNQLSDVLESQRDPKTSPFASSWYSWLWNCVELAEVGSKETFSIKSLWRTHSCATSSSVVSFIFYYCLDIL